MPYILAKLTKKCEGRIYYFSKDNPNKCSNKTLYASLIFLINSLSVRAIF